MGSYATTIRDSKRRRERDFLMQVHRTIDAGGKVSGVRARESEQACVRGSACICVPVCVPTVHVCAIRTAHVHEAAKCAPYA